MYISTKSNKILRCIMCVNLSFSCNNIHTKYNDGIIQYRVLLKLKQMFTM